MDQAIFWKTGLRYGIIMGLGFCAYTLLMWITQLDTTYLRIGNYLDMAIILWPLAAIFMAISALAKQRKVSWWERLALAILVAAVSELIYSPFLYTYHNFINPSWFDAVLQMRQEDLTAQHVDSTKIAQELANMKVINEKQNRLFNAIVPSVIVIPLLMSLLSFAFV